MRTSRLLRLALLLGCSTMLACAAILSGAISGGDRVKIPHGTHAGAKVGCLTCHEEIYDATSLSGVFRPSEKKCLECHREWKEGGQCSRCHTQVKAAAPYQAREATLRLSHATHIERVKEDCSRCHRQLPEPQRSGPLTPPMGACLGCHEHKQQYRDGRCEVCHVDLSRYPLKPVSLFSHQGDYVSQHGRAARAAARACAKCHEQTFCTDCHASTVSTRVEIKLPERIDSDFIHRNDFLTRHSLEAQAEPASCQRCHGTSFCENCHRGQNLSPAGLNPRNPHPAGWGLPGSASFHGVAARRDISSCAACHDQGARSICVDCHKVGGIGGNPHPPGWSARHGHEEIRRNGMCLYCHP